MTALVFLLGVLTIPILYGLYVLAVALFVPDGFISRECGACGWEQYDRVPVIRWVRLGAHLLWGRIEPWHRRSLAMLYLEYGADPITGKPLGTEFEVRGEGVTVLTNMRIRDAA